MIFLICAATTHCLNFRGQNPNAAYTSDTPVTLKQGQGHKSQNDDVDPKLGNNHSKVETVCFNAVCEEANVKGFLVCFLNEIHQLSALNMCDHQKWCYIHNVPHNPMKFQPSGIRKQFCHLKLFDTAVTLKYGQGQ